MKRSPTYPPRSRHRLVAVETLERRRLLAITPLVQFDAATYVTDAVPALQIAGAYAFLTIKETGDALAPGTVDIATSGGTATPGVDYQSIQGTVTLNAANNYSQMVSIPIIDHGASTTPTRTVNLTLSNPTGGLAIGTPGTAILTINEPAAVTATTTTLAASSSPLSFGSPVVFTAFVTRTALGTGDPTGTVTFTVDGVAMAPVAVVPASASLPESELYDQATAQFTTASLGMGPHTITATYSGDSTATASTGTLAETVGQATTTTQVTQSTSAAAFGQPIVFTAIVTANNLAAGTPTGTVTFNIDQFVTILPSPPPNPPEPEPIEATATVTLVPSAVPGQAIAQFTIATLTRSIDHPVNVTYNGDTTFATSVGYGGVGVGNGTSTALVASANPSVTGQPVVFTAVVTTTGPGDELTGTVTFLIDNVTQTPVTITPSTTSSIQAIAQFTTAPLAAGPHLVTAIYSGNVTTPGSNTITGQTIGSTSPTVLLETADATQPVPPVSPTQPTPPVASTVSLYYSASAPVAGLPFVIVATTYGAEVSLGIPTGQAELLDGTTVVGTLPLDSQGEAVFFYPALTAGLHNFAVVYSGDANYLTTAASAGPLFASNPPPPTVVTTQRGGATSATVLLAFTEPVDPSSAQKASNYRVTTTSGQQIKIKAATYDATSQVVTLHLGSRLNIHAAYRLQVIGKGSSGVRGTNGLLLAGAASGQAGTNYQTLLPRANTVTAPVQIQSTVAHPRARLAAAHHAATRSSR